VATVYPLGQRRCAAAAAVAATSDAGPLPWAFVTVNAIKTITNAKAMRLIALTRPLVGLDGGLAS
jgi:hypothetical protein